MNKCMNDTVSVPVLNLHNISMQAFTVMHITLVMHWILLIDTCEKVNLCVGPHTSSEVQSILFLHSTIASGHKVDEESKEMRAPNTEVCQDTEFAPVVHLHNSFHLIIVKNQ